MKGCYHINPFLYCLREKRYEISFLGQMWQTGGSGGLSIPVNVSDLPRTWLCISLGASHGTGSCNPPLLPSQNGFLEVKQAC